MEVACYCGDRVALLLVIRDRVQFFPREGTDEEEVSSVDVEVKRRKKCWVYDAARRAQNWVQLYFSHEVRNAEFGWIYV